MLKRFRRLIAVIILGAIVISTYHFIHQEKTTSAKKEETKQEEKVQNENVETIATLVIDPGHGGGDGGSVGSDDTCEKDLNLKIAKKIGKYLNEINPAIKVVYTRETDTNLSDIEDEDLKARVQISQDNHADYFLSIHLNSNEDTSLYGYSAYTNPDDTISAEIMDKIEKNLEKAGWEYNRGILYTDMNPLYVISAQPDIPSMLFEIGFMSNDEELHDLEKTKTQNKIAKAIAKAYSDYINDHNS